MNHDNLNLLINRLSNCTHKPDWASPNNNKSFNMLNPSFPECGSPACIGGHAADLMGFPPNQATAMTLETFLDVEWDIARDVYYGNFTHTILRDITPDQVIEQLNIIGETHE